MLTPVIGHGKHAVSRRAAFFTSGEKPVGHVLLAGDRKDYRVTVFVFALGQQNSLRGILGSVRAFWPNIPKVSVASHTEAPNHALFQAESIWRQNPPHRAAYVTLSSLTKFQLHWISLY